MTADTIVLLLACWAAVCAASFAVLYPVLSPGWRKTWIGWALFTSSSALALASALIVVGRLFGTDYAHSAALRITAMGLIAAGATLKLTALLVTKARAMLASRDDR